MDAREKAAAYVNVKPRTRQQAITYLKTKGFAEDEILKAVAELEKYHYIDDFQYCQMYFQYGYEKGRGTARIKRELKEKGVSSEVIEMAYDELEEIPDELASALDIGEAMVKGIDINSLDYDGKRKLKAKIGRRLAGRGFSSEIIYKVMDRLV